jgi:uncharacterized membrane protein YhaH (DUF805 family)/RNA polymerase subunit RPABC4/transcription elongation factor Spt4
MDENKKKCPYCGEEILTTAKKCRYCGEWLAEQARAEEIEPQEKKMMVCPVCAEQIEVGTKVCPYCHEALVTEECQNEVVTEKEETVMPTPFSTAPHIETSSINAPVGNEMPTEQPHGFFDYYFIDVFFRHYADFKGKISRKQFWMGYLCYALFIGVISCLDMLISSPFIITIIASSALAVPGIAFIVRRLHDIGKSGWWILIYLVPLVGPIWWLVLLCKKGETKALPVKHGAKDFIAWAAGCFIVVALFIKLLTIDVPSYTDRQPLYPDGTTASLYDDEYLTYLADYKEIDEKTTPDGKRLLIREDVFSSDWDYMSYTWLCIEDGDVYVPLVLVGDWEGTRYKDFSIIDDETIRIELITGQDTPYTLETIIYNINEHEIVDRQQAEYWGDEGASENEDDMKGDPIESGTFSGYIDGKYKITVTLEAYPVSRQGFQTVTGSYYYDKNGKGTPITLEGDYTLENETLTLTEYYEDGTPNCTISAVKVPQGFRGTFTDTKGKEMSFFISPSY